MPNSPQAEIPYFHLAVGLMRSEAEQAGKKFPEEMLTPVAPTRYSPAEIRAELCAVHPDIWLSIQTESLSDSVWHAMKHLMGRTNVIDLTTVDEADLEPELKKFTILRINYFTSFDRHQIHTHESCLQYLRDDETILDCAKRRVSELMVGKSKLLHFELGAIEHWDEWQNEHCQVVRKTESKIITDGMGISIEAGGGA